MQEENLPAPAATKKAMAQVVGPIISTTLVLFSVFVPVAFMPGITGQLYRQFAVTMCTAFRHLRSDPESGPVCHLSHTAPAVCKRSFGLVQQSG